MAKKQSSDDEGYDVRKYVAELLGTMALVFFGCSAVVLAGGRIGYLGISFAFGMVVMVMVYAIGSISGCHINPAITLAMLAARKISVRDAAIYIVVQCIGAVIGAEMLLWIALGLPGYTLTGDGLGQNGYGAHSPGGFDLQSGFIAEVVLTFFFLLSIFGATSKDAPKGFAGVGIGFTLFIVHLVGIPVTGTSVNPARSLGPAVLVGGEALDQLWLFWVAPIMGAMLAALVWKFGLEPPVERTKEEIEREQRDEAREIARRIRMRREAQMKAPSAPVRPRKDGQDEEEGEEEEEGTGDEDGDEEEDEDEDNGDEAAKEEEEEEGEQGAEKEEEEEEESEEEDEGGKEREEEDEEEEKAGKGREPRKRVK